MRVATNSKQEPTLDEEMALFSQGYSFIAGLDEAGRGCLAGPVVAAAVMLPLLSQPQENGERWGHPTPRQGADVPGPPDPVPLGTLLSSPQENGDDRPGLPERGAFGTLLSRLAGVRDSKQLTARERERLYEVITRYVLAIGVGIGSVEVIDERNILQATKYAMRAALDQLAIRPQALLLDAIYLPEIGLPQRSIIKGDELCLSIAAASIIAKVTRDRIMIQLDEHYPAYGFAQHKGYCTEAHVAALRQFGATPHHRRSFGPVRELCGLFQEEELNSSLPVVDTREL